jgi:hypothetical protein
MQFYVFLRSNNIDTHREFCIPEKGKLQILRNCSQNGDWNKLVAVQATEQTVNPGAYLRLLALFYMLPYLT